MKKKASSLLVYCPSTNRVLAVSRRYSVTEWGNPGGKRDDNETALDCGIREALEETGFDFTLYIKSDDRFVKMCYGETNFETSTFLTVIPDESIVKLNPENGLTIEWQNPSILVEHSPFSEYNKEMLNYFKIS